MATDTQRTWILEFLLRQPTTKANGIKRLFAVLQPTTHTHRFTKTLLIRKVSCDVKKGLISWRTLKSLELIQQLDKREGTPASHSLKDAYLAVALHCTYTLFQEDPHNFQERAGIWRETLLGVLHGKGANLGGDTRDAALKSLKAFLSEATQEMGPSFLELVVATMRGKAGVDISKWVDQVGVQQGCLDALLKRSHDVRSSSPEKSPTKKGKTVLTPDFRHVRQALKSSMVDLHDVVKDPLPDALLMAANISTDMVNDIPLTGNQDEPDADKFVDKECQVVHEKGKARPSLMERNDTACTLEWDESPSPSHPHLPTPTFRNVSPLNRQVVRNNAGGKRRKKMWSSLEEHTLIDAVKEYGIGNWTRIIQEYREIFEERTPGDLKDKWRNLTK